MEETVFQDNNKEILIRIAKSFYQAYRLTGRVRISFGVRSIEDSDGNSVVEVYLSPEDPEAAATLWHEQDHARHMQFLTSMVPPEIWGYQFILHIMAAGVDDIHLDVVQTLTPVTS